jgi:phosphatidylserine/phosphatidylglycerophosphate/cardiolipin synthase-like enzyme
MGWRGEPKEQHGRAARTLLLFLAAILAACTFWRGLPDPVASPETVGAAGAEDGWYSVYFSRPQESVGPSYRGGPDAPLAEAIRQARLSLDLAILGLDLWSLRDALKAAHRSGIVVRIVTDSDSLEGPEIQALVEAGIPVIGDQEESLMHNKFIIIDRLEVWTGSMNLTLGSAYFNENNLIRIHSAELAENYLAEFEEMFSEGRFGAGSPMNTPHPVISIAGTRVETYFSPEDGTAERLVALIREAQESVYFLAYSFTSDEIAAALLEKAQEGVIVAGVMDESQARTNTGSESERLRAAGLDVYLDGGQGSMHHKVFLIDETIVVTGSYNFSANAEERNDENTLILYNPEITELYLAEFNRIYAEAQQ